MLLKYALCWILNDILSVMSSKTSVVIHDSDIFLVEIIFVTLILSIPKTPSRAVDNINIVTDKKTRKIILNFLLRTLKVLVISEI